MKNIENILLELKYCNDSDLEQANNIKKEYGGNICNILLNLGIINEEKYLNVLSKYFNLDIVYDLNMESLEKIRLNINDSFFLENNIFPYEETENEIIFVSTSPYKLNELSLLKSRLGKEVLLKLIQEDSLKEIIKFYAINEVENDSILEDEIDKLKELASEAPIIKLVNNIFTKAVNKHVSDIHFESYKAGIKVRFRLDGTLETVENISLNLKQAVIARLKLISNMNISENRLPQDGRITIKISNNEIDIRSSSVPTAFGESFVLRLLGTEQVNLDLDNMHFHSDNLNLLKKLLKKPNGVLLTTGPTGSGKTTTLYSSLNYVNNNEIKIITVEDPVEYQLDGISQIQVKNSIDYTFAKALRSILRQDPDIIMVGEIRDLETARISIQSALTGHFVLSTLHTNSAVGAITRLIDMGIDYYLLKSSVIGLMAQRLTRKLCNNCKTPINISDEDNKKYNIEFLSSFIEKDLNPCKAVGCKECNYLGYKGRIPVLELIPFSNDLKNELDKDINFSDINKFGYRTLQDDAIIKFLQGDTSLDEVLKLL